MWAVLLLLLGLVLPEVATALACTDGSDCYCDCVTDSAGTGANTPVACTPDNSTCFASTACQIKSIPIDDNDIRCFDWEENDWYDVAATNTWWKNGADPLWRGLAGIQQNASLGGFGAGSNTCSWTLGEPAAPTHGVTCGYSNCSIAGDWNPGDTFNANSKSCLDFQRNGEQDDEIGGLTLTGGTSGGVGNVFDGQTYMAQRIRTTSDSESGALMTNISSGNDLGVTYAMAYSSNLLTANTPSTLNGFMTEAGTRQWKHFQSNGGITMQWGGGNTGGTCANPANNGGGIPFMAGHVAGSGGGGNCTGFVATVNIGCMVCESSAVTRWSASGPGSSEATANEIDFDDDWGLGNWACVRIYIEDPSDDLVSEWWVEFQGPADVAPRRIFDVDNWDVSYFNNPNFGGLNFDAYFNGNDGSGTPATETFYRYNDNVHVRNGEPVSCAQIGFGAAAPATPVFLGIGVTGRPGP